MHATAFVLMTRNLCCSPVNIKTPKIPLVGLLIPTLKISLHSKLGYRDVLIVEEYLGGGKVSVGDRVGSLVYPTFTDYWVTDIGRVQPIPDSVSFEVGCLYEPLGCAV